MRYSIQPLLQLCIKTALFYWLLWPILASAQPTTETPTLSQQASQFVQSRHKPVSDIEDHRWQGSKHRLMQSIGKKLDQKKFDCDRVESLLGKADQKISDTHSELISWYSQIPATESKYQILGYFWRGQHDMLAIACNQHQPLLTGWLYSWE